MFQRIYNRIIDFVVDFSIANKYKILVATVLLTVPCVVLVGRISIDTDLLKLLPEDNPAYIQSKELEAKVGDGGHFIALFEGDCPDSTKKAVEYAAERIKLFGEVKDVQYKYPVLFISKYNYMLIPTDFIQEIYDKAIDIEAQFNPFADIGETGDEDSISNKKDTTTAATQGDAENRLEMAVLFKRYASGTEYHQSANGKTFAMLIPTKQGFSNIGEVGKLKAKIEEVCREAESRYPVRASIGGNHANKLIDFDTISHDLNIATIISVTLIVLLLFYSFRGAWAVALVLFPLVLGLLWSFALVPITFGSLNLITSFLTVILFGLGADYPIHIVKRFQIEIKTNDLREALRLSFGDTGLSVIMSALTTAAGFVVAIFSHFRGFYEFGILSSVSIITILAAMFIPFPAALIVVWKLNKLNKLRPVSRRAYLPGRGVTAVLLLITLAGAFFAYRDLSFDYFLSNTDFKRDNYKDYQQLNAKIESVYSATTSPAAIYAAPSVEKMDETLRLLSAAKSDSNSEINRLQSIRDFAPDTADFLARREMLGEMKDIFSNLPVEQIPDGNIRALIKDFSGRELSDKGPSIHEVPAIISDNLLGNSGSGYYLINVYPRHERKDGRVAMALAKELSAIQMPDGVKGPVGESIVFADVLEMVLGEAWQIVIWGQVLVFLVVLVFQRNIKQTLLMFVPLAAGLAAMFGLYGFFDIKITFFSVICIPALMGMGVDGGIHYVNRWYFRRKDLRQTQIELFEPLSSAFLTVIFGYIGMTISAHSGLQSIGLLSALGMLCIWIMNLVLLPALMRFGRGEGNTT